MISEKALEKRKAYQAKWRKEHKEYFVKWAKENPESRKKSRIKFYQNNKEQQNRETLEWFKNNPWCRHYDAARTRCTNPKSERYYRYGARGIEFKLTRQEVKELWFRDKAYEMKQASIDRINNDGNYEFNNCRFLELSENLSKSNKERVIK
jgi:hypothetical protein